MLNIFAVKALGACVWVLVCSERSRCWVARTLEHRTRAEAVVLFSATRIIPFALAFVVLGLRAPGDAIEWALFLNNPEAAWPYTPLFRGLLRTLLWLVPTPLIFVLAMTVAEIFAFATFWSVAFAGLETAVAGGLLAFWVVNPVSLFHVALGGQDEALILLAWCGVALAAARGRPGAGGLICASGTLATKLLAASACLPLVSRPTRHAMVGAAVFVSLTAVAAAALTADQQDIVGFLDELSYPTSGNVWAIPRLWDFDYSIRIGLGSPAVVGLLCCAAGVLIAASVVFMWVRPLPADLPQTLRVTGTVGAVFMLFSPKSPTAWLLMFLPGILFLILSSAPRFRVFLYGAFLPVSVFEPSLWFYLDQGRNLGVTAWSQPLMIAADLVLLTGYAVLIATGLRLADRKRGD